MGALVGLKQASRPYEIGLAEATKGGARAALRPAESFGRLGVRAAINGQRRAGDVLGLGARQERHSVGDVVRSAIPA